MLLNIVNTLRGKFVSERADSDDVVQVQSLLDLQKHSDLAKRKMDIFVVLPNSYDKGRDIAGEFLNGKVVIVNFVKLSSEEKQRMFDYLNGAAYTVSADIKQVTQDTIVYIPSEFVAAKLRV